MQGSFLFVLSLSLFALYEYASYLSSDDVSSPEPEDLIDPSLDTVYLPFHPSPCHVSTALKPTLPLPASCLDAHIARGEVCYNPDAPRLDVLWTWVNGSDILLQDAKARVEASFDADAPYRPNRSWKQVRQFRSDIHVISNRLEDI